MQQADPHISFRAAPVREPFSPAENAIVARLVASKRKYLFVKRSFDLVFSLLILTGLLSWLLPLLAIWIKLDSRGPVFFSQIRVGKNGRPFRCLKLRTMVVNEAADIRQASPGDERITAAGRMLRATHLDELPQFINILFGQMSIVGPRPHMPADCIRFSFVVPSYDFRHLVKPGITGLAQVKGYRGPTPDYESILRRYHWDSVYVRKASTGLDARIMLQTLRNGWHHSLSRAFGRR